jgi:hypothetical protein
MNETVLIEAYLTNTLSAENQLLMEAKILIDSDLREKIYWQQKVYEATHSYGRQQLKRELEMIHQKLFTEPVFRKFKMTIDRIFGAKK